MSRRSCVNGSKYHHVTLNDNKKQESLRVLGNTNENEMDSGSEYSVEPRGFFSNLCDLGEFLSSIKPTLSVGSTIPQPVSWNKYKEGELNTSIVCGYSVTHRFVICCHASPQ